MSGFGAGGFAEGFTAGMGAMNQALALRQEREWRQQQAEQEQQRYGERQSMEKERMAGEREDRALNRQLAERRLAIDESMAPLQREHIQQQTAASQEAAGEARIRTGLAVQDQNWQAEKHVNDMRTESVKQAKEAVNAWRLQDELAQERGEPSPPITPELFDHIKVLHGPQPEVALSPEETQRRMVLAKGLKEGTIPINDPQVASEVEKLHPWAFQRGIGEPGPQGGKIESKNSLGFEEHEGGKLVPLVQVNVRNDDGSMYSYTAPMTEKGSKDPNDGVIAMTKEEAQRSLAAQIMAGKDERYTDAIRGFVSALNAPDAKTAMEMRKDRQALEKGALEIQKMKNELAAGPKMPEVDPNKSNEAFSAAFARPVLADKFLTGNTPGGYDAGENATPEDVQAAAVTKAYNHLQSAHALNPKATQDEMVTAITTGTWKTKKNSKGQMFSGYEMPTGEFLAVEPYAASAPAPTAAHAPKPAPAGAIQQAGIRETPSSGRIEGATPPAATPTPAITLPTMPRMTPEQQAQAEKIRQERLQWMTEHPRNR